MKTIIKSLAIGEGVEGLSCCPVSGPIIASIKVSYKNKKEEYYYNVDFDGLPTILKSRNDIYERIKQNELTDEEIEKYQLKEYNGIDVSSDIKIFEEILKNKKSELNIIKLLMYLTQCYRDAPKNEVLNVLKGLINCDINQLEFKAQETDNGVELFLI